MKLIDKKGRIFGFLNIVDLLVLILIIGLVAVFFIRMNSNKLNANGANPISSPEEMYVTLYSSLVVPEIAESLKVGDKLVANNAFTDAEIVSVNVAPAAYVSTNSDGEAVLSEHPLWKDITVVVKDTVNPGNVILKAGNQEVRVGYSFILKTQTVETNCKIRGVEFSSKMTPEQLENLINGEAYKQETKALEKETATTEEIKDLDKIEEKPSKTTASAKPKKTNSKKPAVVNTSTTPASAKAPEETKQSTEPDFIKSQSEAKVPVTYENNEAEELVISGEVEQNKNDEETANTDGFSQQ